MTLQGKHIVVGISGGIAAYKIPELIRLLIKEGAEVKVTATANALQFVTELTLRTLSGHPVYSDVFAAVNQHSTEHISLPDWADMMLIAPATANLLGKMAAGIADDALTTTFAATVARHPVVVAPAMNDNMYRNDATCQALDHLRAQDYILMVDCAEGSLACGTIGKGRMQEPDVLVEACRCALTPASLKGKKVLITAGPTREKIDPVRYVSNYSSGKMGYAIAQECLRRGAQVTVVSGPTAQRLVHLPSYQCAITQVESADQMYDACVQTFPDADVAILAAAVADFTPAEVASEKRKKQPGQTQMLLPMRLTRDIAAALGNVKKSTQMLVGFALETQNEQQNALNKLESKNLDMIVLNSLRDEGAGFGVDTNKVTLIERMGHNVPFSPDTITKKALPLLSKQEVASCIIDAIESSWGMLS